MTYKTVLTSLMGLVLLLGCQRPMESKIPSFSLNADIIGETATDLSVTRDGFGKTEVLFATGPQGILSVALISTNGSGIIDINGEAPRLTLKGWNALKVKSLTYGMTGLTSTPNGDIKYERFSFEGKNCFHFHKLKNPASSGNGGKYRRMLSGYVCHQNDGGSADEAISAFLNAITIPPVEYYTNLKGAVPVTLFDPVRPVRGPLIRDGGCGLTNC